MIQKRNRGWSAGGASAVRGWTWRAWDPLIQVWLLVLLGFGCGIWGHYRTAGAGGHHKNPGSSTPARLLIAGASLEWTDRFGPGTGDTFRPEVVFSSGDRQGQGGSVVESPDLPDLREAMKVAASRSWKVLTREVRDRICRLPAGGAADRRVQICWSGSGTGNAGLLRHLQVTRARPVSELQPDFVVGNGSWSGNGSVEWMDNGADPHREPVVICLIGRTGTVTGAQYEALGEILNYLEARRGHLVWEVHRPGGPLAAVTAGMGEKRG